MLYHALILLAGPPGTGKSYLMELIRERFDVQVVSFDLIKEATYDRDGIRDQEHKDQLYAEAQRDFFDSFDRGMAAGRNLISDYPFGPKQHDVLQSLCFRHDYQPLTIRLGADFEVLFERQRRRDLDPTRHPGHLVSCYRPGQVLTAGERKSAALTREEFHRRCTTRGYDTFQLGGLIEVDTTDFTTVRYHEVLDSVARYYDGSQPEQG